MSTSQVSDLLVLGLLAIPCWWLLRPVLRAVSPVLRSSLPLVGMVLGPFRLLLVILAVLVGFGVLPPERAMAVGTTAFAFLWDALRAVSPFAQDLFAGVVS